MWKSAFYWTLSILLIISLFVLFFGVIPVFAEHFNWSALDIIASVLLGTGITLASSQTYQALFKDVYYPLMFLLGVSLTVGSIVFLVSQNPISLVVALWLPLIASFTYKMVRKN